MTVRKSMLAAVALGLWQGCAQMGQFAPPMAGAPTTAGAPAGASPVEAAPSEPSAALSPASGEATPAPGPAKTSVSVSIKNNCGSTAKIFFGEKPKFGSGTYSSLGSNTRTNHSFRPGDSFWVVDDGQNGLSSVQVGEGTREIEIQGACDRLAAR